MSEVEMSLAAETATWQKTLTSDLSLLGNVLLKQYLSPDKTSS